MVKIKICGIKRLEDIEIVNRYKELRNNLDSDIIPVGVFVDSPQEEILKLFDEGIIEIAQLHGSESEQYILDLKKKTNGELKIINAIEMTQEVDLLEYNDSNSDYLLLDSGKGSGKTFDWSLIRKDIKKEFFLAGGLNSKNVTQAIDEFNPYAIDLSSSLETDGFKDENKIKEIMEVIN